KKRRAAIAGRGTATTTTTTKTATSGTPSICENCGTLNWNNQAQCRKCGAPLISRQAGSRMMTRRLGNEDNQRSEEFRPDTTLILRMPEQKAVIELCPQDFDRSLIFGRFDQSGGIIPDVDLEEYGGAERGVSRLHMALAYDARRNHLSVKDMGSANGVIVNGRRLPSFDTHILRSGDRIELGNFLIQIVYAHN
ncbi:MAG: FHA domain-containing protein, partial [Chloroflexota bacterium]